MPDHAAVIRDWLKALASLATSPMGKTELNAKLGAYIPLLIQEFPVGAFSATSLAHVARQCKFFPSFAELCDTLSPWWKEHRPPPVMRAITADPAPAIRERENADSWRDIDAVNIRVKIRAINEAGALSLHLGRCLAAALRRSSPQHLGLLPPPWLVEWADEPDNVVALRESALTIRSFVKRGDDA